MSLNHRRLSPEHNRCTPDTVCLVDSPTNSLGINQYTIVRCIVVLIMASKWLPKNLPKRRTLVPYSPTITGPISRLAGSRASDGKSIQPDKPLQEKNEWFIRLLSSVALSNLFNAICVRSHWNSRQKKERPWEAINSQFIRLQKNKAFKETWKPQMKHQRCSMDNLTARGIAVVCLSLFTKIVFQDFKSWRTENNSDSESVKTQTGL